MPTLKVVVGHYKLWSEVMFWFTQMMCYNVNVPLLIRQANDVEENPGPTIYDIIDPTTTVSADFSQGNGTLFGVNAGKQCVAMSLTAIDLYHALLKQKILPVQPLIQCEAGRAKTKLFVPLGLKMAAA